MKILILLLCSNVVSTVVFNCNSELVDAMVPEGIAIRTGTLDFGNALLAGLIIQDVTGITRDEGDDFVISLNSETTPMITGCGGVTASAAFTLGYSYVVADGTFPEGTNNPQTILYCKKISTTVPADCSGIVPNDGRVLNIIEATAQGDGGAGGTAMTFDPAPSPPPSSPPDPCLHCQSVMVPFKTWNALSFLASILVNIGDEALTSTAGLFGMSSSELQCSFHDDASIATAKGGPENQADKGLTDGPGCYAVKNVNSGAPSIRGDYYAPCFTDAAAGSYRYDSEISQEFCAVVTASDPPALPPPSLPPPPSIPPSSPPSLPTPPSLPPVTPPPSTPPTSPPSTPPSLPPTSPPPSTPPTSPPSLPPTSPPPSTPPTSPPSSPPSTPPPSFPPSQPPSSPPVTPPPSTPPTSPPSTPPTSPPPSTPPTSPPSIPPSTPPPSFPPSQPPALPPQQLVDFVKDEETSFALTHGDDVEIATMNSFLTKRFPTNTVIKQAVNGTRQAVVVLADGTLSNNYITKFVTGQGYTVRVTQNISIQFPRSTGNHTPESVSFLRAIPKSFGLGSSFETPHNKTIRALIPPFPNGTVIRKGDDIVQIDAFGSPVLVEGQLFTEFETGRGYTITVSQNITTTI